MTDPSPSDDPVGAPQSATYMHPICYHYLEEDGDPVCCQDGDTVVRLADSEIAPIDRPCQDCLEALDVDRTILADNNPWGPRLQACPACGRVFDQTGIASDHIAGHEPEDFGLPPRRLGSTPSRSLATDGGEQQ